MKRRKVMSKGVMRFLSLEARQQKQDEARVGTGEEFCLGTFGIDHFFEVLVIDSREFIFPPI